jgi:hypothetical protein
MVTEPRIAIDRPIAGMPAMRRARRWRYAVAVVPLLLMGTAAPGATPSRAQSLAQFDVGYARCEQRFEHMRGHRDQAYAGVYRLKLDAKTREQLAAARKSAEYKSASRTATQTLAKDKSADLDKRFDQQCQALWREANR